MSGRISFSEWGVWESESSPLTSESFRRLGAALGERVKIGGKVLVSADSHELDSLFLQSLSNGLHSTGVEVVNLGFLPTPLTYYAARRIQVDALATVSRSYAYVAEKRHEAGGMRHETFLTGDSSKLIKPTSSTDSISINGAGASASRLTPHASRLLCGLQWMIADRVPDRLEVEEIQTIFQDKNYEFRFCEDGPDKRFLDVTYDYVAWLQDTWFDSPGEKTHIVLDPNNGPWTGRARRFLQAVFPRLVFSEVASGQAGGFLGLETGGGASAPLIAPKSTDNDPSNPADYSSTKKNSGLPPPASRLPNYIDSQLLLRKTMQEVDHSRADLGFLLEQDGGQIHLIDGNGIPFQHDELNWLLVQSFGTALENETFLFDSRCSSIVREAAKSFGANLKEIPSGNPSFLRTMQETSALLGVESNGHHYFRAILGYNDALFSICWILDFLAGIGKTPAQIRDDIPIAAISPNIIIPWSESRIDEQDEFLQRFSEKCNGELVFDSVFGFRIANADGWIALGKAQPPDHSLILRIEATDPERLEQKARHCCLLLDSLPYHHDPIKQLGSQIWTQYFEKTF